MPSDPRLESYLAALEKALKPLPVSDRAEIVTEIKSHILSSLERDPQARLDLQLEAMGEPETVANRYLMERGMQTVKPPISPIVKWMVIGFLGSLAMLLIFVAVLAIKFVPMINSSDWQDKLFAANNHPYKGSIEIEKGKRAEVKFGNGKMEIGNSEGTKFSWDCVSQYPATTEAGSAKVNPQVDASGVKLDLLPLGGLKCELSIPRSIDFNIDGANGKLEIEEPHFSLDAKLANGKVEFNPDEHENYRFDFSVTNGKIDDFVSSQKPDAFQIKIKLSNGVIRR
jgi:hypothetical protein